MMCTRVHNLYNKVTESTPKMWPNDEEEVQNSYFLSIIFSHKLKKKKRELRDNILYNKYICLFIYSFINVPVLNFSFMKN